MGAPLWIDRNSLLGCSRCVHFLAPKALKVSMVRTQASNSWLLTMVIQIGILLKPSEMKLMLDALDFDGSGDISLQEFESFWRQAPPLRWNDGKIMAAP